VRPGQDGPLMSAERPLWRGAFDRVEHAVSRPLERVVAGQPFNDLLVLGFRAQGAMYDAFEHQMRAILHFWNIPARTDVTRLHRQVGALSAEVRALADRLEEQQQTESRTATGRSTTTIGADTPRVKL
jgi:hypothetical protein